MAFAIIEETAYISHEYFMQSTSIRASRQCTTQVPLQNFIGLKPQKFHSAKPCQLIIAMSLFLATVYCNCFLTFYIITTPVACISINTKQQNILLSAWHRKAK